MNIEKVSDLGFDGGLFHIFAESSYVRSHVLKKLFVNHLKKKQNALPAIPLNAVCPLVVDFCHHKNFVFLMMNLRPERENTIKHSGDR